MKLSPAARICWIGGVTAVVVAPLPFLAFFFRKFPFKLNDFVDEDIAYYHTRLLALLLLAVFGIGLGTVLLLLGRHLRTDRGNQVNIVRP